MKITDKSLIAQMLKWDIILGSFIAVLGSNPNLDMCACFKIFMAFVKDLGPASQPTTQADTWYPLNS